MFTIKLYHDPDSYNVICTQHYNVYKNAAGVTELAIYPTSLTNDGVTYRISKKDIEIPHWKYVFIENSSGKTIEHIK